MKPRIYWQVYPKSRRGYWRVSPMPNQSTRSRDLLAFAHNMAREMNRALEAAGKPRP